MISTLASLAALVVGWGPQESPFAWRTDLEPAMAEARRDGRPVLIVFR